MHAITLEHYFRDFEYNQEQAQNAVELCRRVNHLLSYAEECGVNLKLNKKTGSLISGEKYGGFRPLDCPIGAEKSAHKQAMAVDIYDPENALDIWLNDAILIKFDLYREHPDHTNSWAHLSTKEPRSKRRTFIP